MKSDNEPGKPSGGFGHHMAASPPMNKANMMPPVMANAAPSGPESESVGDIDFMRYVLIVWEKRWLVLAIMIAVMTIGVLQLKNATPIYTSTAQVRYEPTSLRILEFTDVGRQVNMIDEIATQIEIIRSPIIAGQVVQALGLDKRRETIRSDRGFSPLKWLQDRSQEIRQSISSMIMPVPPMESSPEQQRQQQLIAAVQNMVRVERVEDTKLITITAFNSNRERSRDIADEYANQFIRYLRDVKNGTYLEAIRFLDEQVNDAKVRLEEAENRLLEAGNREDMKILKQEYDVTLELMANLRADIDKGRIELATKQSVAAERDNEAVRLTLMANDDQFEKLDDALTDLKIKRSGLIVFAGEKNAELMQLEQQIAVLEEDRKKALDDMSLKVLGDAKLLELMLVPQQKSYAQLDEQAKQLTERMVPLRALQGDVDARKQIYEALLNRYEEVSVASNAESGNVSIVAFGRVPTHPSEPRVIRSLAFFLILGFMLGAGMSLGLYFLDRSVSDPAVIERSLGLPTLGPIPFMGTSLRVPFGRQSKRGYIRLIHTVDPYSQEAEAFRLLRTSLLYSTAGHSPQLIQVTSCFPSEGKSTVAANLAISFATLGEKTLLLDADLKLPSLHRIFGVPKRPGLSDVLTGQLTPEQVTVPSGIENLDLMPVGPKTPCPVELLESPMMTDIFNELRTRYKTIIVDSTPLYGMSDAYVLSRKMDGVVLVASVYKTRIDGFRKCVQGLQAIKTRILGVAYNHQVRIRRYDRSYYYYTGYYRYGASTPDPDDRVEPKAALSLMRPKGSETADEKDTSGTPKG